MFVIYSEDELASVIRFFLNLEQIITHKTWIRFADTAMAIMYFISIIFSIQNVWLQNFRVQSSDSRSM
jgi:hypothetical protein